MSEYGDPRAAAAQRTRDSGRFAEEHRTAPSTTRLGASAIGDAINPTSAQHAGPTETVEEALAAAKAERAMRFNRYETEDVQAACDAQSDLEATGTRITPDIAYEIMRHQGGEVEAPYISVDFGTNGPRESLRYGKFIWNDDGSIRTVHSSTYPPETKTPFRLPIPRNR